MFDMEARAAQVKARRASAGLVADNGVHCPTQEHVAFLNARDAAKAAGNRDAATTARLTTLKAAAVASTAH